MEGGRNLEEAVQNLLLADDGGPGLFQPVVAEDMVNMALRVDQVLDRPGLFLGKGDHLLQVGNPLGGVNEDGTLPSQDDAGIAPPDFGFSIHI